MKKVIQIILIVLILAVLGFIVWQLFFAQNDGINPNVPASETDTQNQSPVARKKDALSRIDDKGRILIQKATKDDTLISINQDGDVVLIDLEKKTEEEIAPLPKHDGVLSLQFRSNLSMLLETKIAGKTRYNIYSSSSWIALPSTTNSASLSPSGKELALLIDEKTRAGIQIINYQTQEALSFFDLNILDFDIFWPTEDTIILVSRPSSEDIGYALSFNINTGATTIIDQQRGLTLTYSDDLETYLSTGTGDFNAQESTITRAGTEEALTLPFLTLPKKCTFSSATEAYCARPSQDLSSPNFLNDYLQEKLYTKDDIVRIKLSGAPVSIETILNGKDQEIDIDAINLITLNEKLYFINRYDNQLYELNLEDQ